MEGSTPEEPRAGTLPDEYVRKAIQFVVNAHATTVNMHLYPPASSMVTETMDKARQCIEELVAESGIFRVSALENSLLVDDIRLDDIDQQKAPVRSFVGWMTGRGLSSLEFSEGLTDEELKNAFEILSDMDRQVMDATLVDELEEHGVTHVTVNQRVYIAVAAGEDGEYGRKSSPLDALKDELLIRYLMGKVDLGDVENQEMMEVLSDPGKIGGLLSRFLAEEGSEGGVFFRSQKAEEALQKLSHIIGRVEDESLRETLNEQVTSVIGEMSPHEMLSVLTGQGSENLDIRHIRANVITMLSNNQLMDIVDSLIDEYVEMSGESGELEAEWTKARLQNLNEVLVEVRKGERGEGLAEKIDLKLDEAGITEERDSSTGARVLSAYQMFGGALDELNVPDLDGGVNKTASRQIKQLYAMGEDDLAAGMLMRIAANLTSNSEKVRRYAALLLRESVEGLVDDQVAMASNAVLQLLFESAGDETDYEAFRQMSDTLAVAAGSLLKQGMGQQVSMVIEFLKRQASPDGGKSKELASHAELLLEGFTSEEPFDPLELLAEPDPEKFSRMIVALTALGPKSFSPIVDLIKDRGRVELRERALDAFREAGHTATQALIDELERDNQWYVYRNILNFLAELRAGDALDAVDRMVGNKDERIRREAVRTLASIGARESVPWVQQAASDPSTAVRKTAVRGMGMFSDASVAPFLLDIIAGQGSRGKDEDQSVVEAAVLALGDLKLDACIPQLAELLGKGGLFRKGRPEEIRAAACVALGNIGYEAARPALERALKGPSPMVRSAAERSLAKLSGEADQVRKPEPMMQQAATDVDSERRHPEPPVVPPPYASAPAGRQQPVEQQSWQEPIPPERQSLQEPLPPAEQEQQGLSETAPEEGAQRPAPWPSTENWNR